MATIMPPNMIWHADRMTLGEWVFLLQHKNADRSRPGQDHFAFYKTRELIAQYERFWERTAVGPIRNVVELGLWDGGSAVLWYQWLRPDKLVGLDFAQRGDSNYFRRYVDTHSLEDKLKTYWGVDQGDSATLRRIVDSEFTGPLDLVLDDASHIYGPTKSSFQTLFPLLRDGGLYIIEDWAWAHWPGFTDQGSPLAAKRPPTDLVVQLIEATGTSENLIRSVTTFQGFVAVERAATPISRPFQLEQHIHRPSPATAAQRLLGKLRGSARKAKRRLRRLSS